MLRELYGQPLSLLTDLYQFSMAAAAWKAGVEDREAVFHLVFRRPPFKSGFTIAAGLGPALEYVRQLSFTDDEVRSLAQLRAESGEPMFERAFLDHLRELEPRVDIDAVPEGTAVFPQEPLLRVSGPIVPCMLLESPLLNLINFQTLIATKAARVYLAAQGDPVLEFGLRRAQGPDGALSAARAAYIGGCAATSNVLAGKLLGIPVDSGDLAWLSIEARKLLDAAGFTRTVIYASNELDEHLIASLKQQGAKIGAWGVGTRLVTGAEDAALGGVFKLSAVRPPGGSWERRIKLSDRGDKISVPGILQVQRFSVDGEFAGDLIYDLEDGARSRDLVDRLDPTLHERRMRMILEERGA